MRNEQTGAIATRLSIMMFLEFFLWGAWYVTVGNYMAQHHMAESIGWAYTVGPIAALVSPFFLGMIADRFFSTERVLGVLHILGGISLLLAPQFAPTEAGGSATPFLAVLMVHMLCYMPTLGLTNSLAFHHMDNPEKQFPLVRVFGTIGWIVAGVAIAQIMAIQVPQTDALAGDALNAARNALPIFFYVAGGSGILLGLYSFSLPHTPPPAKGTAFSVRDALGLDTLDLLKERSFAVFVLCSFLICIPLAAYYAFAPVFASEIGMTGVPLKMTFGQMSEIFFMLVMPIFFIRLGIKWMLLIGMLAWVARYGLFATAADDSIVWMVLAGILLHGICYDFFFVAGFIYTDKKAPVKIRGAAQGFLVLVTQGLGLGIGAQIMGQIVNSHVTKTIVDGNEVAGHDWKTIWGIPALFALGVAIIFFLFFKDRITATPDEVEAAPLEAGAIESAV